MFLKSVLRLHKDRCDLLSGQIIFHLSYNVTYYMDPDAAKLSRLKCFKFIFKLILKCGIRNVSILTLNCLRLTLQIVLPSISFTYYMKPKKGKIKQFGFKNQIDPIIIHHYIFFQAVSL